MAQTTYSRWFNQFEFPNENGLPYKSSGGKMIWNDKLKREIPESWTVDEVLNLINWQSSSQPPKSDFSSKMQNGYMRFIQNRDYDSDTYITYIPISTSTKTCTQYDIMIDKYGDAGKTRYGLCGAYNVALAKIEPVFNNNQEYLRKYFEQEHTYRFLHKACIASTRASLNENILSGLAIVVPDDKTLVLFENLQKDIINQILNIQKENNRLQSLKNSILPLLINGQLKI